MPGENIPDWSTTASSNSNADSSINWVEHMPRADVNNSARGMMAASAKDRNLKNGSITTTGTANAQLVASGLPYSGTVPTGLRGLFKIGAGLTNTGVTTLNMDSIGAVAIKNRLGADLKGGELKEGSYIDTVYNGTNWMLWNDPPASADTIIVQPPVVVTGPVVQVPFIGLTSDYRKYTAIATGVFSDTADDTLILRFSTDNGATYKSDAAYQDIFEQYIASAGSSNPLLYVLPDTTELSLTMILDNTEPTAPAEATVELTGMGRATMAFCRWVSFNYHQTYGLCFVDGVGTHLVATTVNAVQFSMLSGGNITAGTFTLYGTK